MEDSLFTILFLCIGLAISAVGKVAEFKRKAQARKAESEPETESAEIFYEQESAPQLSSQRPEMMRMEESVPDMTQIQVPPVKKKKKVSKPVKPQPQPAFKPDPVKQGDITAQSLEDADDTSAIVDEFTLKRAVVYSEILKPKFQED